jgi:hypothetical protein
VLIWPTRYVEEELDYKIDWTRRLKNGERIIEMTFTQIKGTCEAERITFDLASVNLWIKGGTRADVSVFKCEITTDAGRTMDTFVQIRCY